ncbi:MarR family winged helix-turn-helix transcriptional regulator [Pedobacter aquatilis]|uniref:MarR family winged helix-turn-helix transcriptional regulator n=1 Tax=Pedobacter aquatilis TaxID=351343 RepID=UPI0025B4EC45|nr:MarR family winged helix-turn-helix transcriptional regulator [Pedobacter aquatilis]MDN3588466.1 MarR family winged helix-turn-helix transcriptional regulator [Pedobacter aquatilis]
MYNILRALLPLINSYESGSTSPKDDLGNFLKWLDIQPIKNHLSDEDEPEWQGKVDGRSADSVINTGLVHLYRYAKIHAKIAIAGSIFSTPDEFIYLICLSAGGPMSKTALIRENIHDKPAGILIIKRLLDKALVAQEFSRTDKRAVVIAITDKGKLALSKSMDNIRTASANVTQPLSQREKVQLISLLRKLEAFHYEENFKKVTNK